MDTQTQVQVQHTKHTQNTRNKLRTVLHARQQNAEYSRLYTAEQHAQLSALVLAVQPYYFTKRIYTNFRKRFCTVTVYNTTSVCYALHQIAKKYNAQIVVTQNSIVLRLFA